MFSLLTLENFRRHEQRDKRISLQIEVLQKKLSNYRYIHSLAVADISLRLCELWFPQDVLLQSRVLHASLLHDYTKEWAAHEHISFAREHNFAHELFSFPPPAHHAITGSKVAEILFSHNDKEILQAIYHHTTGCYPFPLVAEIVYCADYMASAEISLSELESVSLSEWTFRKTSYNMRKLNKLGAPIHPNTYRLYQCLSAQDKKNSKEAL